VSNSDSNPWKTHSVKEVYDNAWINVSHREVSAPTGADGIYGLVHFKNTAVAAVPIDSEGNTWIVGQHRYTLDQYSWEVPEGGGEQNEDTIDVAKRELKEETGIIANIWTPLLEMHTSNSVTDEFAVAYVAQDLSFGETEPDDTEQLAIKKLPLQTAIEMAMDGRISDGFAMACLLKIHILLERGKLTI